MRRLSILLSVVLTVLVLAPAASAEWFADAYLGAAITSSSTLTFTTFGEEQKQSLNGRSSPLFGLRFGRWLEDFDLPWLGVAADVSYFRPATDVQTVPLSLLVKARYGFLKDDEFKAGRLQPYVGLGGALFFSHLSSAIGCRDGRDPTPHGGLDPLLDGA